MSRTASALLGYTLHGHEPVATPSGACYLAPRDGGELISLAGRGLDHLLDRLLEQHLPDATLPPSVSVQVRVRLERYALDQPRRPVHVRVAPDPAGPGVAVDLADQAGRSIQIDGDGWRIRARSDLRRLGAAKPLFLRAPGMLALPEPHAGGDQPIEDLVGRLLNVPSEDDRRMIVSFLLGCFMPAGPFPLLHLVGEAGSAKSCAARVLRQLVDPAAEPLSGPPGEQRDLLVAAQTSHVPAFDNISAIPGDMSDALCRISTGGGLTLRKLYTDGDSYTFSVCRPVILTSIGNVISRGDLADRSVTIRLPRIIPCDRLDESELEQRLARLAPLILGRLCDVTACALKHSGSVRVRDLPRLARWARWVSAAEPALGWPTGTFVRLHRERHREQSGDLLAGDLLAPYLFQVGRRGWRGTARDLLHCIDALATDAERRSRGWPATPRALTSTVTRLAPLLAEAGDIAVHDAGLDRHLKVRIFELRPVDQPGQETLPEVTSLRPASGAGEDAASPFAGMGGLVRLPGAEAPS